MFPPMDRFGPDFLALVALGAAALGRPTRATGQADVWRPRTVPLYGVSYAPDIGFQLGDRKSTRLNSSHSQISYAVFCLKKKKIINPLCIVYKSSIVLRGCVLS